MDLKRAAKEAGLTGVEISDAMGVTPATVSRWLNGKIKVPLWGIRKLAALLSVDPLDMIPNMKEQE